MIDVSVLIPIYNAQKYLHQCIESVMAQTEKNIEIICINDGSIDASVEIIKQYAEKDQRIILLDKENSGYGDSLNRGLDIAKGQYIAILESDDWIEPNALEELTRYANAYNADVVKSEFYYYWNNENGEKNLLHKGIKKSDPLVIKPSDQSCFRNAMLQANFFCQQPSIWSAIYRKDFLFNKGIKFNPTPGASYQDISFGFITSLMSEKSVYIDNGYVHYRQDNENSSVKSTGKVYCVCDEYEYIRRYIDTNKQNDINAYKLSARVRYENYIWNINRLSEEKALEFIKQAQKDFAYDYESGYADAHYFIGYKWRLYNRILSGGEDIIKLANEEPYAITHKIASRIINSFGWFF